MRQRFSLKTRLYTTTATLFLAFTALLVTFTAAPAFAGGAGPVYVVQRDVADTTIVAATPPVSIPDSATLVASDESAAVVSFAFNRPTSVPTGSQYVSAKLRVYTVAYGQLCVTRALFDGVINPTSNILPPPSESVGCYGLVPGWNKLDVSGNLKKEVFNKTNVDTFILTGRASVAGLNSGKLAPSLRIAVGSATPVG